MALFENHFDSVGPLFEQIISKKAKDIPSLNNLERAFIFNIRSKYVEAKATDHQLMLSAKQVEWVKQLFNIIEDPVYDAQVRYKYVTKRVSAIKRENLDTAKKIAELKGYLSENKKELKQLEKSKLEYKKVISSWSER